MKVLLVDDHVIVREGLRRLLIPMMKDVTIAEATNAPDALTEFRNRRPDIVLLDLNLPKGSGLELLRRLIAEDQDARILILTMHCEPLYAARALDAGARGYISKSAGATELINAIHKVAAGGRYVEHEIAAHLVLNSHGGGSSNPLDQLTTREIDILRQLGEGKSLVNIAASLGVTYKTIANSCSIIRSKLGVGRMADLIRLALEMRDP
jgi:two-component system invasion response regulator UvrY